MFVRVFQLFAVFGLVSFAPAATSRGCPGCVGTTGSASASGGSCEGWVSITVTMHSGTCKLVGTDEPVVYVCSQITGCVPTVTRQWGGLPAGSPLDFCVIEDGVTMCVSPQPNAGSGAGQDPPHATAMMQCQDDDGRTYTISSPTCALNASVTVTCTSCLN